MPGPQYLDLYGVISATQLMFRRLRQFAALNANEKLLILHAWWLLGYIRAATLSIPFKHLTASLQHHRQKVSPVSLDSKELEQAARIGKLVSTASKYTPWHTPCLTQVLVVQRLLCRRGIPGQFYLGVRKGGAKTGESDDLEAHAWLQCDNLIVSGGVGCQDFAVLSTYSWGRS